MPDNSNRHRVDKRILLVRRIKVDFTCYCRYAKAITIISNAFDDSFDKILRSFIVNPPEAERVQRGNRSSPHREDIPHDSANAGRRSLIRLDSRWVIVAFDLEGNSEPVSDIDKAGIFLSCSHQEPTAATGESLEQGNGVLVAAVFAPHHTIHSQLSICRNPAENLQDHSVFFLSQPMLQRQRKVNGWFSKDPG